MEMREVQEAIEDHRRAFEEERGQHAPPEQVLTEIRDLIRDLRQDVGGLREEIHLIRERLDALQRD
jgi:hypothetical protein